MNDAKQANTALNTAITLHALNKRCTDDHERERERNFYKLWLANKANRLRQGLDDPAHFIKLYHINDIHAGTKFVHSSLMRSSARNQHSQNRNQEDALSKG